MAIGLCGGWLLSKRVTRPIRVISETARAISASDLSRRIDVREADSELGSLAQTLNETFERLETAFQRQVRFTADASHELRTPLSIIHSHAELALTRDRTAPEYKQAMETCLRAAKRTKVAGGCSAGAGAGGRGEAGSEIRTFRSEGRGRGIPGHGRKHGPRSGT